MCGIFGWIPGSQKLQCDVTCVVSNLFAALAERGPDDRGFACFNKTGSLIASEKNMADLTDDSIGVLLGQTRLAVIDLSAAGHQPMFSQDKRYCLIYNGEVYNYLELRNELKNLGYSFNTATDSELVLTALIHWKKEALLKFNGMFAFAFFDRQEKRLFCARDFFGIKPFYYNQRHDFFAFASELPALLKLPGLERKISLSNAAAFLFNGQIDVGGETLIEGVRQLPAGHYLEIELEKPGLAEPKAYWRIPLNAPLKISFQEAAAETRRLFLESVRLHLRSDVPLGVALSGGIDSSSVACAVRYIAPDMPLHTFSYIAAGSDICEEQWADEIIKYTGAIAHKITVEGRELAHDLDHMILRQGEPFCSTSIYAQYRLYKLVRECGVVVTLDGQGADEMLAGYYGYTDERIKSLAGRGHILRAAKVFKNAAMWPGRPQVCSWRRRITRSLKAAWEIHRPGFLSGKKKRKFFPAWFNGEEFAVRGIGFSPPPANYHSPDKVREILATQLTWHGLPNLLRHGDRNAMTFSIESRVPFCNRTLAEFLLSLPEHYLVTDEGLTKAVFKEAMRDLVPDKILSRRDKIGFLTPEKDWFMAESPWVEESLHEKSALLNQAGMLQEWQKIRNGQSAFGWRIWRWINYLRWKVILDLKE